MLSCWCLELFHMCAQREMKYVQLTKWYLSLWLAILLPSLYYPYMISLIIPIETWNYSPVITFEVNFICLIYLKVVLKPPKVDQLKNEGSKGVRKEKKKGNWGWRREEKD